jgi:hypothetical protein
MTDEEEPMRKPKVIGLLGRAGSGKTTAGKYLVEKYGAKRVSFAAPLKRLAQRIMEFRDEQLYGPTEVKEAIDNRYGMSATQFLQRLGDGAREEIKYDVWVEAALEEIRREFAKDPSQDLFVIDDCRYINEAEKISLANEVFGKVVKLVCPDAVSNRDPNHPSEAQVDEVPPRFIDQVVISKRSPESVDLKEKIDAMMGAMFPPETSTGEVFKTHGIQQP